MRHKKWWWAIFMWGIGVARVNAYKIYEAMWDEERAKGRNQPVVLTRQGATWIRRGSRNSAGHAEHQFARKSTGNKVTANDTSYALAA